MNSLTDFINNELNPALFERLDKAFPDMDFKRKGNVWKSPKHLDGRDSSDGEGCYSSSKRYFGRIADCRGSGSESFSFVDFEADRMGYGKGVQGEQLISVLERLCSVCGLSVPKGDTKEYSEYKERQEALFKICKQMEAALFKPEGADVLKYLKERRGYSEELIKEMGLGALTEETKEQLKNLKLLSDIKSPQAEKWYNPAEFYRLAIPYISGGRIRGFKFRLIEDGKRLPDGGGLAKYRNTNGGGLKEALFGVSGARITGVGSERDITIVEGELDALRAQAEGFPYVVAATGGDLNIEALRELKKKGADKITLLFDRGEQGSTDERTLPDKIRKALQLIDKAGLRGYVAEFPPREDGKKVDLDSFLLDHSAEELKEILSFAETGYLWIFNRERDRYIEKQGGEGERCTLKDLNDLTRFTCRLYLSENIRPEEWSLIRKTYEAATGYLLKEEDIQKEADILKAEADKKRQEEETQLLHSKAASLLRDGKTEEALLLMREGAGRLERISREIEFSHYLDENIDSLFEEYKGQERGVSTNISLRYGTENYRFILPSGALTFIGGATGHGKSRLLQSLALDLTTDGEEGTALYISYEENRKNVNRQLLNAFIDLDLTTNNNEQTLQEFLCNNSARFIKSALLPEFYRKLEEYKQLRQERLRLIKPQDNTLETLEGLLRYAFKNKDRKIRAVFIDYVQEIYLESTKRGQNRTDELKDICITLDSIAQETDTPIVLAAQLKADVESPLSMSNQDIADSINIARKASEVILLWSSAEKPLKDKDGIELGKIKSTLPDLHIGERGTLYVKLTKSRLLPKGAQAFLSINGNTGRVRGNYREEPAKQEPTQKKIFDTSRFDG